MAEPFLRWAGGKRWLAGQVALIIKKRLNGGRYIEPFLGSGAMFFSVEPKRALLSDLNKDLITAFNEVARNPESLRRRLLQLRPCEEEYYRIRDWYPETALNQAVRFIYLNRNCWGGLYRENKKGAFNVPYGGGGRNHKRMCLDSTLDQASLALSHPDVQVFCCDFESSLAQAGEGDVVYCDPTYRRATREHFDRYGQNIFSWHDQERLALLAVQAAFRRGALVLVSNASCFGIRELYQEAGVLELIRRKGIGTEGTPAARVEYLFILDPKQHLQDWQEVGRLIFFPRQQCNARQSASHQGCRRIQLNG